MVKGEGTRHGTAARHHSRRPVVGGPASEKTVRERADEAIARFAASHKKASGSLWFLVMTRKDLSSLVCDAHSRPYLQVSTEGDGDLKYRSCIILSPPTDAEIEIQVVSN